ncbi:MAG: four helix bundle protein [bacterium]
MTQRLDHEKLRVYQEAVRFVEWRGVVLDGVPKRAVVRNQLDRASTGVPLNIAEGNGRHTPADRCRFFDIARGSALECGACLDGLVARNYLDAAAVEPGKRMLARIVSMLVNLIRANSADRVYEGRAGYGRQDDQAVAGDGERDGRD